MAQRRWVCKIQISRKGRKEAQPELAGGREFSLAAEGRGGIKMAVTPCMARDTE